MKTRLYRHYKNKTYKFLGLVRHSETLEEMALYETLYQNDLGQTWVRPKDMFFGQIEINGRDTTRFAQVDLHTQDFESISELNRKVIEQISEMCGMIPNISKAEGEVVLLQIVYDLQNPIAFQLGYADDANNFISLATAVLPEYQHLGIALGLAESQHQWCRKNKFTKIRTYLLNKNKQMLRINLKLDYHIAAVDTDGRITLEKNI